MPLEIHIPLKVKELDVIRLKITEGGGGTYPVYTGETTVEPKTVQQNLETANKSVLSDINVLAIPVSRTPNPSGGMTVSIAFNG